MNDMVNEFMVDCE